MDQLDDRFTVMWSRPADVADLEDSSAFGDSARERPGRPDALVNVAGRLGERIGYVHPKQADPETLDQGEAEQLCSAKAVRGGDVRTS